jgi:hypothetical protein
MFCHPNIRDKCVYFASVYLIYFVIKDTIFCVQTKFKFHTWSRGEDWKFNTDISVRHFSSDYKAVSIKLNVC